MLTDQQIAALVQGHGVRVGVAGSLAGQATASVCEQLRPAIRRQGRRHTRHSVRAAMEPMEPELCDGKLRTGSLVDPAYLALISDQGLRSLIIAGQPGEGMPDWRSDINGAGSRAMTDQEVTDIVAWLGVASGCVAGPALCASIDLFSSRLEKSMSEFLKYPGESSNDHLSPEGKAKAHTRRVFLFKLAVGLNALVGAVLAVPLVGYLLGPALKKSSSVGSWVNLGEVSDFPVGETRLAEFRSPVATFDDGQTAKVPCWVRRISAQEFQVFAINCAHLGCPVRWFSESKLFLCPCHGGAYYAGWQQGFRTS